ncbi:MAG: CapA family protein [Candidatus Margulisbacteria bacterium]|nr:CapA family protein [Candidatus Margulisiibacteriota bacterium]
MKKLAIILLAVCCAGCCAALEIDNIFESGKRDLSAFDRNKLVTVMATGNVMLGRGVLEKMSSRFDYGLPFRKMASVLRRADISMVNLVSPLVPEQMLKEKGGDFSAYDGALEGLELAEVDVVNMANREIMDSGEEGMFYTKELLAANRFKFFDEEDIAIMESKGSRFAFVGFSFAYPGLTLEQAVTKVRYARQKMKADVIVAGVNFGAQYSGRPDLTQRIIARTLIDAGADLIVGNYSQYVQGVEIYKNKLITYSHGNFIVDDADYARTGVGVIGRYTFYNNELVDASFVPVEIKSDFQPDIAGDNLSRAVLAHMKKTSEISR